MPLLNQKSDPSTYYSVISPKSNGEKPELVAEDHRGPGDDSTGEAMEHDALVSASLDELLSDLVLTGVGEDSTEEVIAALSDEAVAALPTTASDSARFDTPTKTNLAEMSKPASSEFTGLSKSTAPFDIPVKQKRYSSRYRDAKTIRQIRTLQEMPALAGDATLLVSKALFSPPSLPPYKLAIFKPWWHESMLPPLLSPARQYRTPAPWRDVSDEMKVTFRHLALKTFGPVYAITLNLSDEVEALARSQDYPLGWLRDRVSYHLKEALGRSVQFHLVAEEAKLGRRLHIHGEMQITLPERRKARPALRKAGGAVPEEFKSKQLRIRPNPDAGWLNYLTTDLMKVSFSRNVLPKYGIKPTITFAGNAICYTDLLNAKAAEIYEQHRQLIRTAKI